MLAFVSYVIAMHDFSGDKKPLMFLQFDLCLLRWKEACTIPVHELWGLDLISRVHFCNIFSSNLFYWSIVYRIYVFNFSLCFADLILCNENTVLSFIEHNDSSSTICEVSHTKNIPWHLSDICATQSICLIHIINQNILGRDSSGVFSSLDGVLW